MAGLLDQQAPGQPNFSQQPQQNWNAMMRQNGQPAGNRPMGQLTPLSDQGQQLPDGAIAGGGTGGGFLAGAQGGQTGTDPDSSVPAKDLTTGDLRRISAQKEAGFVQSAPSGYSAAGGPAGGS